MNYDRADRIRRAAILVASLEETLAAKMLETLPSRDAERVLAEVDRLGAVDPEEQEDVVAEFRRAGRRGRSAESAVEFTYSAPPAQPSASKVAEPATDQSTVDAAITAHSDADAALLAELLANEHPQTIAAALSRLSPEQGAAVFAALPAALQADVLDRLANLEPGNEEAVLDLQSQLEQRIQQQRQRRQRAAAAAEMARRMLEKTAPAQRATLLARLSPEKVDRAASDEVQATSGAAAANQAQNLASAMRRPPSSEAEDWRRRAVRYERRTDDESKAASSVPGSVPPVHEDLSHELESLSDWTLLEALRLADERTVQRALAASSEGFLQRVAGKLPRRQAARLRRLVRSLGPTRLAELREAQHEFLRIAHECAAGAAVR